MATRLRSSESVVIAIAAITVGAAVPFVRLDNWTTLVAFAILVAASEMFEVTLPNEVRYSLGLAPALGLALLGSINPTVANPPFAEVIAAFTAGMIVATGLRALRRTPIALAEGASRLLALAAGASVYNWLKSVAGLPLFDIDKTAGSTDISIVGFVGMFLTVLAIRTTLTAVQRVERDRVPFMPVARGILATTFALHLSVLSVGALLAVAYPALDYWAFPLYLAPLAMTQYAFKQFASIRKTYLQTIRALSKVPEMAGYTQPGHSTRVAKLSVAIAQELGVPQAEQNEIEYAALLHDIGRVSIPEPDMVNEATSKLQLATVGAAIIRETGHFPRVADMIEKQHHPYRKRGEGSSVALPPGAKIIKVASAYDDHTRPGGIGLSPFDVLDRLSLGMAFDYDPEVVQALRRVLEKQGAL